MGTGSVVLFQRQGQVDRLLRAEMLLKKIKLRAERTVLHYPHLTVLPPIFSQSAKLVYLLSNVKLTLTIKACV